jgi:hypothetical protein
MQIKPVTLEKGDRRGQTEFLKINASMPEKKLREILDGSPVMQGQYKLTCENYNCVVLMPLDLANYSGFAAQLFDIANAED